MGLLYSITRANNTFTAANDLITLKAVNRSFGLREYIVSGHGTASASNEFTCGRNTGGTVATATMLPLNTQGPSTSITTFGLNQTVTGPTAIHRFGVNSNGALFRWVAAPGMMIEAGVAEQVGINCVAGTGSVSATMVIEQF
jgi:hypothetical protein